MDDPAPITNSANEEQLAAEFAARERVTVLALVAMLFYQGFAVAIVSVAAPWIGTSFHLDGAGIARLFAWISLSALGALALSRMIDRYGRRRMILWCMAAIPVCSIGAAVSTKLIWFTIFQIGLYAVVGAAGSGCVVMLSEELPIARRARGQSFGGLAASVGAGLCVFLMPIFDGLRMVVAMDVRDIGGGHRDAAGDGAAVARERAMGSFRRVGNHQPGRVSTTSSSRSIASDRSR